MAQQVFGGLLPGRSHRTPADTHKAKLVDREIAAINLWTEGLLMAPAFAIPLLLARPGLTYADIDIWEIHEAFAAQVLAHMKPLESSDFLRQKAGVAMDFGAFPRERMSPNGGSIALGHPFGATGARILSQTVKALTSRPAGQRAIVSICADGGQGSVVLLEAALGRGFDLDCLTLAPTSERIPAAVSFHVDYETGLVKVALGSNSQNDAVTANKALIGPKSGAAIALSQRQFGSFTRYTDPRNAGRYSSCSGTKGASNMF
jgi:Thiolase, C-terminal domain